MEYNVIVLELIMSRDPVHVPVGSVTRARAKKFKESLMILVEEIWKQELRKPIGDNGVSEQSSSVMNLITYRAEQNGMPEQSRAARAEQTVQSRANLQSRADLQSRAYFQSRAELSFRAD
ncbi:uncharacterized protein LOC130996890 [Salvia miltiorrhiza]|uniref:uncharacterized protein LOC130996890 n=1 Tax=Salvia miltiorrhiza TaxID=226208 RepID=UPI0025AC7EC3|nr:uncharacterized protein LOC130996890 [Salvia miltiorrhiza]